jgi:hypothetical protein
MAALRDRKLADPRLAIQQQDEIGHRALPDRGNGFRK